MVRIQIALIKQLSSLYLFQDCETMLLGKTQISPVLFYGSYEYKKDNMQFPNTVLCIEDKLK